MTSPRLNITSFKSASGPALTQVFGEVLIVAIPNMISFVASFAMNMITFMVVSSMSDSRMLAGVGLGTLVGNIFGIAIGIGLTSVLDTVVSQAVGAGNQELAVIQLNRARVVSAIASIPCFLAVGHCEQLLLLLRQDPELSAIAGEFVKGMLVYSLFLEIA